MRRSLVLLSLGLFACGGTPANQPAKPPPVAPVPSASASKPVAIAPSASASASAWGAVVEKPAPLDEIAALTRFFSIKPTKVEWFAPAFNEKVPFATIEKVLHDLEALGPLASVDREGPSYFMAHFAHGTVECIAELDGDSRFSTLLLQPPKFEKETVEQVVAEIRALPGKKTVLVLTDGKERAAYDADRPLAVGSTFKLAILAALRAQISVHSHAWKDLITLSDAKKSLPSGLLQDWPDKSVLTLETLATLMISKSDNTATDILLDVVGRSAAEALSQHTHPFLSTREAFILKYTPGAPLGAYIKGDEKKRQSILADLAKLKLPKLENVELKKPTALEVEWFFTGREKCSLMDRVADLPLMSVNPGVAKKKDWDTIAFKGGSEPGVLDLTTVVTEGGHKHCVTVTWNDEDKALDEPHLMAIYGKLLEALKSK